MSNYCDLNEGQRAEVARYNQNIYHGQTVSSNEKKRADALIYLRGRGKYLLDSKFTPTPPEHTDVAKTIREYLEGVK